MVRARPGRRERGRRGRAGRVAERDPGERAPGPGVPGRVCTCSARPRRPVKPSAPGRSLEAAWLRRGHCGPCAGLRTPPPPAAAPPPPRPRPARHAPARAPPRPPSRAPPRPPTGGRGHPCVPARGGETRRPQPVRGSVRAPDSGTPASGPRRAAARGARGRVAPVPRAWASPGLRLAAGAAHPAGTAPRDPGPAWVELLRQPRALVPASLPPPSRAVRPAVLTAPGPPGAAFPHP